MMALGLMVLTACSPGGEATATEEEAVEQRPFVELNADPYPSTHEAMPAVTTVITNVSIMDGHGGLIENGMVPMDGGNIAAIGDTVDIPDGAVVVDGNGQWVIPGIIDVHSHLGVYPSPSGRAHSNGNEATSPNTAGVWAEHSVHPQDPGFARALAGGVTTLQILPGSANLFGGISAIVDLSGELDATIVRGAGMTVVLGASGASHAGGARGGSFVYLIRAFEEAQRLALRGEAGMPTRERDTIISVIDAEALIPVIRGEMPMLTRVSRAVDILQVIALLDQFEDLDIVIVGGEDAWMVANDLRAANIPVIVDAIDNLPSFDGYGATLYNAARLSSAGVDVSFVGPGFNSYGNARLIPQGAGIAVAHGMDWDAAMAAMTINPARIFGIDDQYGSLEVGKDADVVIWDGDPLEVMSAPTAVFILGEEVELTSRQTQLRDRYMDLNDMERPPAYNH